MSNLNEQLAILSELAEVAQAFDAKLSEVARSMLLRHVEDLDGEARKILEHVLEVGRELNAIERGERTPPPQTLDPIQDDRNLEKTPGGDEPTAPHPSQGSRPHEGNPRGE